MKLKYILSVTMTAGLFAACNPNQYCYRNEDCESPMICNAEGTCDYVCTADVTCGKGFVCENHLCVIPEKPKPSPVDPKPGPVDPVCENPPCEPVDPVCENPPCEPIDPVCNNPPCEPIDPVCENPPCDESCEDNDDCDGDWICRDKACVPPPVIVLQCPENMALIRDTYCIDRYEASRPDATASSMGSDDSMAVSKAGVMPWQIGDNNAGAEAACNAAGKRLCTPAEWELSCHGVNNTVYGYGDGYDPQICNGLDTYGRSGFHLTPTGFFENCHNGWGVYDMSGNLWEHTANGSGSTVRGGAYNCVDSQGNHKCSYIPQTWTPLALGFRCCADPVETEMPADEVPQAALIFVQPQANPRIFDDLRNAENRGVAGRSPAEGVAAYWAERPNSRVGGSGPHTGEILLAWDDTANSDTATDAPTHDFDIRQQAEQILQLNDAPPQAEVSCESPEASIDAAVSLWDDAETGRDAVKILKDAHKCYPDDVDVTRALGIAYARVENYPWALKTLTPLIEQNPDDCRTRSWIAWIYLQMGMTDDVSRVLGYTRCEEDTARNRLKLIESFDAIARGDTAYARAKLDEVYEAGRLTKSDREALVAMQKMTGNAPDPNLSWKVELSGGYASNALSGSPTDPRIADKKLGSGFLEGDVRITIDPWKRAFARSIFEAEVTGQYLFAKDAVDSSYIDLIFRPGILLTWDNVRFGGYYRPEFLITAGDDTYNKGPLLSYSSHRIEFDLDLYGWLYIFGGYGHRTFRQRVRTRDEADIGAGGYHGLGAGFALTWGATYRHWFSTGDMYDLNGTNVSLALDYRRWGMLFRLNGSYAFDDYADSKGYFDQDHARRDHLVRGTLQIWSPERYGLKLCGQFKASRRWSSADDYDYTDYRIALVVRWTGDLDFYAPSKVADDFDAIPYHLEQSQSAERIRDIIQQDEDLQRSSSCLQK